MNEDPNDFLHTTMPFMELIGAEAVRADPSEVVLKLDWSTSRCTSGGILHGGALMSLADGAGAWCAFLNLPGGANTTTLESKTNLLRAVREGTVTATAHPLHIGRRVIIVDTELSDDAHRLVARTTQTQMVLAGS
jgi:1,4-dihydroxy-2-naphthoyl-CoA hydrolase